MAAPLYRTGALLTLLAATAAASDDFDRDIGPILAARCLECHNATDRSGGLDLTTRDGLTNGGDSGPAVEPGDPDASELIRRVAEGEMPPRKQGRSRALPNSEVALLTAWVRDGAPWPSGRVLDPFERTTDTRAGRDWWSLQPIERHPIPATPGADNPVDAFILAALADRGWEPAPEADRRTLIRRVTFDLTGLPPSIDEVEAFAADDAPGAYERLVDRLLASPHFGERQGRLWLDLARYADTSGYERDQEKPFAWKYRDWVISALNADMPYDRFITEQLAGDEVDGASADTVVATGFLRLGTWNDEPNDPQEYKFDRLEDMVHATGTAFLALTIKCARCHDHKFDPITQADYHRIASAFWAGPIEPAARELLGGPDPAALGYTDLLGWTDRGRDVPPLHLLRKGDPNRPGPIVEPAPPSFLPALDRPFAPPPPHARTTTRRFQLARWITDLRNPLTPRVAVNRIWQQHFGQGLVRTPDNLGFNGERPTHPDLLDWLASELLAHGWRAKPLHRLIVTSRTYKQASLHPRQEQYAAADAGNRLCWRAERRRLDAEGLRDALLAAAGRLDRARMGGPGFLPDVPPDALEGLSTKANAWTPSPPAEQVRRAVYLYSKRSLLTPLMTTFDLTDTTLPCARRDVTLVPTQSLALLNNPFVHEQSAALARRVAAQASSPEDRVRLAWRLTLARDPTPSELDAALAHLDSQAPRFAAIGLQEASLTPESPADRALASLCHVLLNTNEFLFLD
jgi:mono/diheme cytochrome c family protein